MWKGCAVMWDYNWNRLISMKFSRRIIYLLAVPDPISSSTLFYKSSSTWSFSADKYCSQYTHYFTFLISAFFVLFCLFLMGWFISHWLSPSFMCHDCDYFLLMSLTQFTDSYNFFSFPQVIFCWIACLKGGLFCEVYIQGYFFFFFLAFNWFRIKILKIAWILIFLGVLWSMVCWVFFSIQK